MKQAGITIERESETFVIRNAKDERITMVVHSQFRRVSIYNHKGAPDFTFLKSDPMRVARMAKLLLAVAEHMQIDTEIV